MTFPLFKSEATTPAVVGCRGQPRAIHLESSLLDSASIIAESDSSLGASHLEGGVLARYALGASAHLDRGGHDTGGAAGEGASVRGADEHAFRGAGGTGGGRSSCGAGGGGGALGCDDGSGGGGGSWGSSSRGGGGGIVTSWLCTCRTAGTDWWSWGDTSAFHKVLTWVGESDILGFSSRATIADVRLEHDWEGRLTLLVEFDDLSLGSGSSELDRCTVHVHLTVANLIEPGPTQGVFAWSHACRDPVFDGWKLP